MALARAGIGMRVPGSEQGRRGASRATMAILVHAATVLGECSSSQQRGRGPYVYGPNGDPQEYARVQNTRRSQGTHQ